MKIILSIEYHLVCDYFILKLFSSVLFEFAQFYCFPGFVLCFKYLTGGGGAVASEGEPVGMLFFCYHVSSLRKMFYCLHCCCFNNISFVTGDQVERAGREKFGAVAQPRSIEIGTVLITVLTIIVVIDFCCLFNHLRNEFHRNSNSSTNNRTRSSIC